MKMELGYKNIFHNIMLEFLASVFIPGKYFDISNIHDNLKYKNSKTRILKSLDNYKEKFDELIYDDNFFNENKNDYYDFRRLLIYLLKKYNTKGKDGTIDSIDVNYTKNRINRDKLIEIVNRSKKFLLWGAGGLLDDVYDSRRLIESFKRFLDKNKSNILIFFIGPEAIYEENENASIVKLIKLMKLYADRVFVIQTKSRLPLHPIISSNIIFYQSLHFETDFIRESVYVIPKVENNIIVKNFIYSIFYKLLDVTNEKNGKYKIVSNVCDFNTISLKDYELKILQKKSKLITYQHRFLEVNLPKEIDEKTEKRMKSGKNVDAFRKCFSSFYNKKGNKYILRKNVLTYVNDKKNLETVLTYLNRYLVLNKKTAISNIELNNNYT